MKKLNINQKIELELQPHTNGKPASFQADDMLNMMLQQPLNPQGATKAEMMESVQILNLFNKAKKDFMGYVLLEKNEYDILMRYVSVFRFTVNDPAIVAWITSIEELPDVVVEEKVLPKTETVTESDQ